MAFLDQVREGFREIHIDDAIKEQALAYLQQWLTEPAFAAYRRQLEWLIHEKQWAGLLDRFYQILPFGTGGRRGPVGLSGSGKTINMSSAGMLIETDQVLLPGWRVEVEVSGPFQVDDQVFLKLLVTGRIVRSVSSPVPLAGLHISRHTFQTPGADRLKP